jgi:hypothetical protein
MDIFLFILVGKSWKKINYSTPLELKREHLYEQIWEAQLEHLCTLGARTVRSKSAQSWNLENRIYSRVPLAPSSVFFLY